jgi:hypothetical protein
MILSAPDGAAVFRVFFRFSVHLGFYAIPDAKPQRTFAGAALESVVFNLALYARRSRMSAAADPRDKPEDDAE